MDNKGNRSIQIKFMDKRAVAETILNIVPCCLLDLGCPQPFAMGACWLNWHQWRSVHTQITKHRVFHIIIDDVLFLAMRLEGLDYVLQVGGTDDDFQEYFFKRLLYIPDTVPQYVLNTQERLESSKPQEEVDRSHWASSSEVKDLFETHNVFIK
jgi:hypothetical protein